MLLKKRDNFSHYTTNITFYQYIFRIRSNPLLHNTQFRFLTTNEDFKTLLENKKIMVNRIFYHIQRNL